jgi:8-oxo-dGTP diphosphatase
MKTIQVVAAIIMKNNRILCAQRNISKLDYISCKFEFPGGKMEEGESEKAALIREIKEELNMDIHPFEKYITVDYTYPDFRIIMHCYKCSTSSESVDLKEHLSYQWLNASDLMSLDWAAADVPIVKKLMEASSE